MAKKSSEEFPSGIKIYLSNPWNLIKTGFLVLTWIVMAIHIELVGPTMPILAANANVDNSGMGSVLASRGAGYLVANILGVILQNIVKKHSDGLLICAFILPAIVVFVTPFVTSLILMCVLFFIQGVGQGFTDLGGINLVLTMWGVNAAAPLNAANVGYGIGALLVNLLVRPFVTKNIPSINATDNQEINTMKTNSNIFIPYTIVAGLCVLIAIGFVFFYIRELKSQRQKLEVRQVDYAVVSTDPENVNHLVKKETSPYSPSTCGRGYFQYGLIVSMLFISSVFVTVGNDQTFSKFFFTYLKSDTFHLSTGAASWGIIIYWLSYSIGRLSFAIVSVFLSVTTCLNIVWFGGLCLAITWLIFVWVIGLTGTSLLILGAITGLLFSPIIPLTFAFFNQRLNVVPILLALALCGSAFGMMAFQKLGGLVMDYNPKHFPTLLAVCIMVSILFYIISNAIYFFHQRNNLLNAQPDGATLPSERFSEEEEQMANYLKDREDT